MACEGLKNNTKGRTIQASCSITHAAGNIQPVFCLMTGGNVISFQAHNTNILHIQSNGEGGTVGPGKKEIYIKINSRPFEKATAVRYGPVRYDGQYRKGYTE